MPHKSPRTGETFDRFLIEALALRQGLPCRRAMSPMRLTDHVTATSIAEILEERACLLEQRVRPVPIPVAGSRLPQDC